MAFGAQLGAALGRSGRQTAVRPRHTSGMNEASLQFHIEENDYFGTLATVLDLVSQDLRKKGGCSNAETLRRLRDRLMYLQQGYRIEKMQSHTKIAGPL